MVVVALRGRVAALTEPWPPPAPPAPSLTRAPQPAAPATGVAGVAAVESQEDDGDDEPQGLQPGGTVSTEPADSGAVPCTHQDGQQDSGADHAPQSPAASAVVFRPTDVAHMLEPRSFAGVDPSATPLTCEQLRQIRATPVMPASGVQPLFLEWYYRCIYEPMVITKSRPVKAIVWRRKPKETAGFGNQLRGECVCCGGGGLFGLWAFADRRFALCAGMGRSSWLLCRSDCT